MTLIHVTVTLADGQEITRYAHIEDTTASPHWWAENIRTTAPQIVEAIAKMAETLYGTPPPESVAFRQTLAEALGGNTATK